MAKLLFQGFQYCRIHNSPGEAADRLRCIAVEMHFKLHESHLIRQVAFMLRLYSEPVNKRYVIYNITIKLLHM